MLEIEEGREGGREGERERERERERETSICCLSYVPRPGTAPAAVVRALTGNGTCNI